MPFFPRDEKDIITESLQKMSEETNITQLTPGGKARFFLSTIAREQARQQETFDENLLQAFIKHAQGRFLDFFGDMLNLPRVEASHAEALNNNVMFYVATGVFGDANGNSPFTISAGTPIYTKEFEEELITPGLEAQPVITYTTLSAAICQPTESFVYVPVRASVEGSESSVPKNTLTQHDFNSYTLSSRNLLKVTNRFAIDNGVDRESNDHYRYRLANIFRARNQAVRSAIRLAALSVQGVADVTTVTAEQGPGTFSIYIQSVSPTVSPDLVSAVYNAVELVTTEGNRAFVSGHKNLGLELTAVVSWSPRASKEQITIGYQAMRNAIESKLNNLAIGESLELAELIDIMLEVAPLAISVGRDRPNTFENVYVYRETASGTGSFRNLFFSDKIEPLYNEKIILETSNRYRGIQFITI